MGRKKTTTNLDETTIEEPLVETTEEAIEENVIDVDLDAKDHIANIQRYRIAKDNNRIIELDVGDGIGVVRRFKKAYENIKDYLEKVEGINLEEEEDVKGAIELIEAQEEYIRGQINYIFGTDVCTPVLQDMSVMTTKNGDFAFEYVISEILKFYEKSIEKEANAIKSRVNKHTSKYW